MKFSRRSFLAGPSLLTLGLLINARPLNGYGGAAPPSDVWMATPDIVAFTVDDPPIIVGNLVSGSFNSRAYNRWFRMVNPMTGNTEWCCPIGINRDQVRFSDKPNPAGYLDKIALRTLANYSVTGATVTAIYYRNEANGQGSSQQQAGGSGQLMITQRHTVYLKLSGPLSNGTRLMISNSAPNTFSNFSFTFNDRLIRAGGIQVNQIGQRPDDALRYGYLAARIPGGVNQGTVDFINTYGFSSFQILDSSKATVFTGSIVQRVSAAATTGEGYDSGIDVADISTGVAITAISRTNPCVVTCPGHSLQIGDKVRLRGVAGMTQISDVGLDLNLNGNNAVAISVTNVSGNDVTLNINSSGFSAFRATPAFSTPLGGFSNLIYKCFNTNRAGTYVFGIDFSLWTPSTSGTHYIYIPGYGISDPFQITSDIWAQAAAKTHQAVFNQRLGCAVSSDSGYSRGIAIADGVNGCTNYQSTLPSLWCSETGSGYFSSAGGATPPTIGASLGAYADAGTPAALALASLTSSGVTATATTISPHGIPSGTTFYIQMVGFTPSSYNFVSGNSTGGPALSTGANTFTYNVGGSFGAASVLGSVLTGFVTTTRTGTKAATQDAGDNDDIAADHIPGYQLLALAFRDLPKSSRFTPYTVPLSTTLLDPTLFAGTDLLPPLFHELFWYAEQYRLGQNPNGSVWGGTGYGSFGSQIPAYPETIDKYRGTDAGGTLTGQTVMGFAYACDHFTTFCYAGLAAKLAQIAYDYSLTTLGDTYKASAIAAYAWADRMTTDITAREAYYNGALNLQAKAGWDTKTYQWAMWSLNGFNGSVLGPALLARMDAAGALFRLLGGTAGAAYGNVLTHLIMGAPSIANAGSGYAVNDFIVLQGGTFTVPATIIVRTVDGKGGILTFAVAYCGQYTVRPANPILQASTTGSGSGAQFTVGAFFPYYTQPNNGTINGRMGMYDYCATPGANAAVKSNIQTNYISNTLPAVGLNASASYMGMMYGTSATAVSFNCYPNNGNLILIAHMHVVAINRVGSIAKNSDYLKLMQGGSSFVLGANLSGKAYQTGTGPRPVINVLHEDSWMYGSPPPYGIMPFGQRTWASNFMFNNFAGSGNVHADSTSQFIADNVTGSYQVQATPGSAKMWDPWRFGSSFWEWSPENRAIVFGAEFALAGGLLTSTAIQLWCHGWDGNT